MKNALVIGGSGGIGAEIVRHFVRDGRKVWATYHEKEAAAEKLISELGDSKLRFFKMDTAGETSVAGAMASVLAEASKIDALVFSVTPAIAHAPVLKSEWPAFQKHLDAQVKGFYLVVKALESQIRENYKTKIVVLLSEYCTGKPASGISDYITAKYALMGMAKSFAAELSRYGTTVNMVSPGMTQTDLISGLPPKAIEFAAMNNPLKRIAVPKDVAGAVSFLISDDADYLNGINLLINGGGVMI